jgi:hypothetical protein
MTGKLDLKTSWGPFSPLYLGISHILDASQGSMADLALFVGRVAPRSIVLPDNAFDYVQSVADGNRRKVPGAIPEEVSPDYSSYALRYFLDPQGDTALARFTVEANARVRCDITFRNTSEEPREYFYGLGLSVSDTQKKVLLKEEFRPWWLPACDYGSIEAYQKAFALGCRQCLTRSFSWGIEDEVLDQAFGGWAEDCVTYRTTLPSPLKEGFIYFRYIKYGDHNPSWELRVNGRATRFRFLQTWAILGGGWGKNRDAYEEWGLLRVAVGSIPETDVTVELRCLEAPGNDRARIWLDGMLFSEGRLAGEHGELSPPSLVEEPIRENSFVRWESSIEEAPTFMICVPDEEERRMTIAMDHGPGRARSGTGSLVAHLRERWEMPPARVLRDTKVSPWGLIDSAPIAVAAGNERTVSFTVALDRIGSTPESTRSPRLPVSLTGTYSTMASRLADILLFNVNYPMRLFGQPSAFYVPSKFFPVPYSWDGGLIAVGLATFAPDLALQQAAYFMADEEHDFPLIYAGSPVPTTLYALWDIYQATQDLANLAGVYSGAKRMYDFYLGRTPGSLVNANNDGLLSTYAYNYNLGLDDHPIQRWAESCNLTSKGLYSILLMPQILRMARIMRNIAILLNHDADAEVYRADIELLSGVIENRMWDEESGRYGWLRRTETGVERLVFDGSAGDPTVCAFLPLFAGLTAHKERLIAQMMDPERFLVEYGISSVDRLAPSYNPNGYINGGVWPMLQWYLWRGLLEAGEPALARQLAELILKTWQHACDSEHYLGELIMINQKLMNGTPNFGGLSAVLLPMRAAYYQAYQVTTLYDVVILNKTLDRAEDTITLLLSAPCLASDTHDLLMNMGSGYTRYSVTLNGQPNGEFVSDEGGHLCLLLPRPSGRQEVTVRAVRNVPGHTKEDRGDEAHTQQTAG